MLRSGWCRCRLRRDEGLSEGEGVDVDAVRVGARDEDGVDKMVTPAGRWFCIWRGHVEEGEVAELVTGRRTERRRAIRTWRADSGE